MSWSTGDVITAERLNEIAARLVVEPRWGHWRLGKSGVQLTSSDQQLQWYVTVRDEAGSLSQQAYVRIPETGLWLVGVVVATTALTRTAIRIRVDGNSIGGITVTDYQAPSVLPWCVGCVVPVYASAGQLLDVLARGSGTVTLDPDRTELAVCRIG